MILLYPGLRFDTYKHMNVNTPYTDYDNSVGYYLKLHGSVDWVFCLNNSCRAYNRVYPIIDTVKDNFCSDCHEKMDYLIIPPVLYKQYKSYPFIQLLWNVAKNEMQIADEIIIWGYSIPPTDFYSNWLLRQARKNVKSMKVIDPACVKKDKKEINEDFNNKFYEIYKNCLEEEDFKFYYNFEDFLEDKRIEERIKKGFDRK